MSFDGILIDIQNSIRSICNHCGECCKNELFHLTDVEAPIIAHKLKERGGIEMVKSHILRNPYIFNIFSEYIFKFDSLCPFHIDNRCSIYPDRPMTCRLFPIGLGGLFDNVNRQVRDPFLLPTSGKSEYKCSTACMDIISRFNDISNTNPALGTVAINFVSAALLDEKSLAYCFGQARARGADFIDTTGMTFANEIEVMDFLFKHLSSKVGIGITSLNNHYMQITDDEANHLASVKMIKRQTKKTSKRLIRLREERSSFIEWHETHFVP